MANEFVALRARARDKRDKAIADACTEYGATLVTIASLEQDLYGKESSRHKMISACIESVIPRETPFTSVDILAYLEALDSRRVWRKRSVDNHILRLRGRGLIRRIKRPTTREPAIYVLVDVPVTQSPFGDMTLAQVMRAVLVEPMMATELTVRMLEAGYETTMGKKALRNAVGAELRNGGFIQEGAKWVRGLER
jgi:hypothetical protein